MAAIDHLARALHYMDRLALPKNVKKNKQTIFGPKADLFMAYYIKFWS